MKTTFINIISLSVLAGVSLVNSQVTFENYYGNTLDDYGRYVAQTGDSGYIVTGGANGKCYGVRISQYGSTYWTQVYDIGPGCYQTSLSGAYTSDNGCVIVGTVDFFSRANDVLLVKASYSGYMQWVRTIGDLYNTEWGYSVDQTFDGGYIMTGYTTAGGYDVYLIRTDYNGISIWEKYFGGDNQDFGYSVIQSADSCYVVAGRTSSFGAGYDDVYLIKTDQSGDTLWTRTYGGYYSESGNSIAQTDDGGYIIAGRTQSYGAGGIDVYAIRTDENGDAMWIKVYGGISADYASSVTQTTDGGFIIAGTTTSYGAGASDVYLIKTDENGDTVWTRTYGGTSDDYGNSVAQTADGGYIIAGTTESFGTGGSDVYVIKTDHNGNVGIDEEDTDKIFANFDVNLCASPNPFRDNTMISYSINTPCRASVRIYNAYGRCVKVLKDAWEDAGAYSSTWYGRDNTNHLVAAGVYYVELEINNNTRNVGKIVYVDKLE